MSAAKQNWPRVKLGKVCEVRAGDSAPQDKTLFVDGRFPFVRMSDVGAMHYGVLMDSRDKLNAAGTNKLHRFKAGSILFPKSGASTFLNHRVMLGIDAYVVSHLAVITPGESVDGKFLLSLLAQVDAKDLMQDTSYPALRASEIAGIELPLPPLPVQREIVARLERELGAVDELAKKFEELEQTAEAEFKAELKETFEELGNGADGTRHVQFGEVSETLSTRGHQIKQSEICEAGRYPVVSQSANAIEGFTDVEIPITDTPIVLFGDHTCEVKLIERPFVVGADGVKLLRASGAGSEYLYHWLKHASLQLLDGEYRRHYSDLCEMTIPLPPLPVQREIVARLDAAKARKEALVSAAKHGREAAALWRKSILKEAFE